MFYESNLFCDNSNVLFQNVQEGGDSNITILIFFQFQKHKYSLIYDYEKL